ncbi:MAG: flagellar basal-body MS-ring/collar protein FliF [Oceanicaulis sp.]
MEALQQQLARFGIGRLAAILGLTAGAAAALVIFTMTMNSGGQALLYSGLQPNDAAAVTERLDAAGLAYELREGGTAVYVDAEAVDEARMRVASGGALGFGSVGYEIFDETDALGTTSFVQNVNARRALEGELARSINTLANVSAARVHLVLPERRLFSRDQQEPSASVVITVNGELRAGQVETIRNLVATAVAGLSPTRITIADDSGRLLASPTDAEALTGAALEDRRNGVEEGLRRKILDVVEGVVGPGAARVVVTAELNRESETTTSTVFDPNTQVEVSRRSEEEMSEEPLNDGAVSVSENTPDAEAADPAQARLARSSREITERNFENSSTQTTRVREAGAVERLAVSVVVDQIAVRGEDGAVTFEPRSAEEMDQIRALVAAAAGFPVSAEARTPDQILEVEQMRFSRPDLTAGTPAPSGFLSGDIDVMRIAEIAVLFLTALLIIVLVARPLVRGAISGPVPVEADGAAAALPGKAGQARIAARGADGETPVMLPEDEADEERIDVAQIDGQVKKSSVRKVAALVEQHPDETMSILRTWMHEDA